MIQVKERTRRGSYKKSFKNQLMIIEYLKRKKGISLARDNKRWRRDLEKSR